MSHFFPHFSIFSNKTTEQKNSKGEELFGYNRERKEGDRKQEIEREQFL